MAKTRARSTIVVLLVLLMVLDDGAALASNFYSSGTAGTGGTTNGVWLTDNRYFHVAKRSLSSTYNTGVNQALDDYETTDLFVYDYSPGSCPDASYDTCVYDSYYGNNGFNGWNACVGSTVGSHGGQVCTLTWVRINQTYSPPAKRIACHELGHSVGLRHTSSSASCMKTSASGGTSAVLNNHDKIDAINWWY